MKTTLRILLALSLLPTAALAQEQTPPVDDGAALPRWGVKTNLLYDATTTFNLGVELRTGGRTSLDLSGNYNPWTFSDNRKWKHYLVQPEFRWWTKETFRGSFFGLHGHYALYNVGNLPRPPFSQYMKDHRLEGWALGAGLSYGYRWNLGRRVALEATAGAGYARLSYDRFECRGCGEKLGSEVRDWFGPTKAGVTLVFNIGGGKAKPTPLYVPTYVPEPVVIAPVVPYEPKLMASFVTPATEDVKARSESGSAYLDFAVGRSEIVAGFRNNAAELAKIHATIESVSSDPDATVTGITITGYASPEGTYATNLTLSERRAQALKDHIRAVYSLRNDLFAVRGAGEDWDGLDTLVAGSDMTEKYRVLEIIRGTGVFDGRERRLMELAGGAPYRRMKAAMFPQLRRSDYSIGYTVVPFTVEKGKEVFRTRPGNLSLNEMFLIANTYEPGSDARKEVFETAARVFPASDVANLLAAAGALERGDAVSAARYLDRYFFTRSVAAPYDQTAAYWNNMGVLAWMQGDKEKAAECFARGGATGADNAAELEKHLQSVNR